MTAIPHCMRLLHTTCQPHRRRPQGLMTGLFGVRFKRDAFQVSAPARQAQVFAKVRTLAQAHEDKFPGLADIVESTCRTLVAGFIAGEARLFHATERIPSR